jgi:hypothetical protein
LLGQIVSKALYVYFLPRGEFLRGGRDIEMDSEKIAGILGAIVAAAVLGMAFFYVPIGQTSKPAKQIKVEQPAPPGPPPVRGPVVREVPQ